MSKFEKSEIKDKMYNKDGIVLDSKLIRLNGLFDTTFISCEITDVFSK